MFGNLSATPLPGLDPPSQLPGTSKIIGAGPSRPVLVLEVHPWVREQMLLCLEDTFRTVGCITCSISMTALVEEGKDKIGALTTLRGAGGEENAGTQSHHGHLNLLVLF